MNNDHIYGSGVYEYLNRKARRKKGQRSGFKVSTNPNFNKPKLMVPRGKVDG